MLKLTFYIQKVWKNPRKIFYHTFASYQYNEKDTKNRFPSYLFGTDAATLSVIDASFSLYEDFVTEDEENELIHEINPLLKRRRYEVDHWDGAITKYKETEKMEWSPQNNQIIQRLRDLAFPPNSSQIKHVHVLDLAKEGHIKPHVDSIRFCGDTIAGLSLLSSSVMRLVMEKNKDKFVDILLSRRSLYIMRGSARYDFTHEILEDSKSFFNSKYIKRDRRISVICRNEPLENVST